VKRRSQVRGRQCCGRFFSLIILVFLALGLFFPAELWAKPVNVGQVKKAVRGWLKAESEPMGTVLGRDVGKVETFSDEGGEAIYYVVYLEPSGFVIVPADDLVEPIIAFVAIGSYDPSDDNPLGALVSGDVPARVAAVRGPGGPTGGNAQKKDGGGGRAAFERALLKAQGKWAKLQAFDEPVGTLGVSSVSDVRVAPLTESTWGQSTIGSYIGYPACYNYYTPPYAPGDPDNYPCGCVATAMSQLMRYHEYPSSGPSGSYVWSNMPLEPDLSTTEAERQAIGHLCFDAAESVDTTYGSGGSSASTHDACYELKNTFGYSNSIYGYNNYSEIGAALTVMINPNLDGSHPVIIAVHGISGGHAIVCDGYGYNTSTLYHHLNMGWSGFDNAWYNLPTIVCSVSGFQSNIVHGCVYNVFTSGSGEIISGRITDPGGGPLAGATVTATGGGTHYATSNSEGIYALAKIPSGTSFTISVAKGDWDFSSQFVSTGTSTQDTTTCGNRRGIDFTGTISAGFIELDKENYTVTETVGMTLVDTDLLGNGSQNVELTTTGGDTETVALSENPSNSGIFTGSIGTAEAVVVTEDGTLQVWHGETITATYQDADDGTGSPAVAEDTATVTGLARTVYEADFTGGLAAGWSVVDGYSDDKSWTSTNPGGRTNSNWNGTFMIVDSDWAGAVDMDEELVTHSINCSYYYDMSLKFTHYFRRNADSPEEIGDVDIRVDGGSWQNLTRYQGGSYSGQVELDVSAIADGEGDVQIRWRYYNANSDYYWGVDNVQITAKEVPHAPFAISDTVSAEAGTPEAIGLEAVDDGTPGAMSYIICSLPNRGSLSDPGGGTIGAGELPYTLVANGKQVTYTAFGCYEGPDSFGFKADDGGTPPDGGESNTATITIQVWRPVVEGVIFETDFEEGLPGDWSIIDGYSDGHTWFWAISTADGRKLMVVDSDGSGYVWMDEQLVTGNMDCSDYETVSLIFEQLFAYNSEEIADVDVRVGGGAWQNVAHYQYVNKDEVTELDISAIAAGHSDVQIRWHYYDAYWDWYWVIYDVTVIGSGSSPAVIGDFQGDCGVNFLDFAFLALAWGSGEGDGNWNPACDISDPSDDVIDEKDLDVFGDNWLVGMSP